MEVARSSQFLQDTASYHKQVRTVGVGLKAAAA
jgi:hypothetical protein